MDEHRRDLEIKVTAGGARTTITPLFFILSIYPLYDYHFDRAGVVLPPARPTPTPMATIAQYGNNDRLAKGGITQEMPASSEELASCPGCMVRVSYTGRVKQSCTDRTVSRYCRSLFPPNLGASFCWTATTDGSGRHATVMLSTRPASFRCM